MSFISAHVLDAVRGAPAAGIAISLSDGEGRAIAEGRADDDGRIGDLGPDELAPGDYAVSFATGEYFATQRRESFFPRVTVHFTVSAGEAHYHVPLLLSAYSYTTYRGS